MAFEETQQHQPLRSCIYIFLIIQINHHGDNRVTQLTGVAARFKVFNSVSG